jgi:CRISPR-associated protein Cas1
VEKTLFITTHGLKISKYGNYLIAKGKEIKERIPFGAFDHLFILSNVTITTQTLKALSKSGKYVFIINTAGKVQSIILPEFLPSAEKRRLKQYEKIRNENSRIYLVKELLFRKAIIAEKVLEKFRRAQKLPISNNPLAGFLCKTVESMLSQTDNIKVLRGIDGYIMKSVYSDFAFSIESFSFKKRSYHPPKDEANAVLSLIFSMFYSLLIPLVVSYNFDPYVGFFHEKRGIHAPLASDLSELVKPELIFFTANVLNSGYLDESDFKRFKDGCYLRPNATRVVCKLFMEKILNSDIFFPVKLFIKEVLLDEM